MSEPDEAEEADDRGSREALEALELHEQLTALAGVPAHAMFLEAPEIAARRGTVLLLHGLTASKELQRTETTSLARHGYLAIALDAVGHGARSDPDFAERFAGERGERAFFELVQQSAAELPAVVAALFERGWAVPGRLGACGISMGGFILFGAVTARCPIDAVVTIVASPRWLHAPASPHQQLDRFFPTALLIQNASEDETVPPQAARELHQALAPRYATAGERLRYLEHAGEPHMFSAPAWQLVWDETLRWFERFLRAPA